ncbi:putative gamma-glutamylcyclotransferase CG2811 isoform X2 [Aethina tumida]|uniref:putative gamma-glutamylcyclotransferase CG2811 isoform X2 n=1 Tax=Aethina tumida TaxID=116153 RepID=UPI00096B01CC|nr:putative gamma-glutamylcyclotransferase CG2811 isoform X2 [Aethina tumida]
MGHLVYDTHDISRLTLFMFLTILTNMSASLHKVFVYGTLKTGEPNHYWFDKDKEGYYKFLFNAKTKEKFPLIIATEFNIPFLLYSPGSGQNVMGEVYEVDDKVLAKLDILEEHPDFYVRELYDVVRSDGDNEIVKVWIYMIKKFKPDYLTHTTYENYSSHGSHGRPYSTSDASTLDDLN